jgi:Glycosyltransferase family 87
VRALPRGLTGTAWAAALAAVVAAALWFGLMEHASSYQTGQIVDTGVYQGYADQVAAGHLPYRDFPVEYPPLAFAAFLPPRLAGEAGYADAFTDLMGLMAVAVAAVAALAAGRTWGTSRALVAGLLAASGPAIAGSVGLTRFDLWPTLLVALALWAAAARRDTAAGAFLGLGLAAKLWPALCLVPLLALAARRGGRDQAGRTLAAFVLAGGLPFALALGLSPSGLWHSLSVQAGRPLQVESSGAALLVAVAHLGGEPQYGVVTTSGSQNLTGGAVPLVTTLTGLLAAAGVLAAWLAGVRAVRRAPGERAAVGEAARFALAAVVAAMAFGRVLSPQYVLWLLPFPLLLRGGRVWLATGIAVAAMALTAAEFPGRYWLYADGLDGGVATLVLGRDAALVAILAVLLLPALRVTPRGGTSRSRSPVPSADRTRAALPRS